MKARFTKFGIHLFDRGSGINILLDEIDIAENRVSIAPANVSIALTNRCNRNCPHCFAPKFSAELNYEKLCNWIDELECNGCLGVGFGGGEPTLYPRLKEICQYVHGNTRMACTLTTNGDFLDDAMLDWMVETINFLRLSSNGNDLDYKKIQHIATKLSTGINFLLNQDTLPRLDEVAVELAKIGVKEILLLPQVKTVQCDGVDEEFMQELDSLLLTTKFPLPVTISSMLATDMKAITALPGDVGLRQYMHISADGFLKRSSLDKYGISIEGKSITEALKEAYKNENMVRV